MKHTIVIATLLSAASLCNAQAQELRSLRPALPFPPRPAVTELAPISVPRADQTRSVEENRKIRNVLEAQRRRIERRIHQHDLESICGLLDDSQHVERYDGTLGPTRAFVDSEQSSTAQIQWRDVKSIMKEPGDDPGNVSNERWCSGTLIAPNRFLTAGHCLRPSDDPLEWVTPKRTVQGKQVSLPPSELAPLMHLNFNYQMNGQTGEIRSADVFPIARLLEHDRGRLDYAILEIGRNAKNELPNVRYQVANMDASAAGLSASKLLTIIQHPHGKPKLIEAGPLHSVSGPIIRYADLDTLGGSSGSGVINQRGQLVGVHTNGGCHEAGGENLGVTLRAVSQVSDIVK